MKHDKRTLWQAIVAAGFDRQKDVLERAKALGEPLPQPTLSAMVRGSTEYPQARKSLARVLDVSEARVLGWIGNSAAARVEAAKAEAK